VKIPTDVLRDLDPRKSYDRGAWVGLGDGLDLRAAGAPALAIDRINVNLSSLSTQQLRQELERRANSLLQMKTRRERLAQELAALDAEIATLEGAIGRVAGVSSLGGGGDDRAGAASAERRSARLIGPRPKNSLNLPDAIAAAVEPGQQVSPSEAADLVLKGGYVTTSKSFRQQVAVALGKHAGFKRLERGKYERIH